MLTRTLCTFLAALLIANPVWAAGHQVIQTDWSELPQRIKGMKTANRKITVTLATGQKVKTRFGGFSGDSLEVRGKQSAIPRDQIRSIVFEGRTGKAGLIGLIGGAAAGIGVGVGVSQNVSHSEGAGVVAVPVIGAAAGIGLAVLGYLIGRGFDDMGPEFVLHR